MKICGNTPAVMAYSAKNNNIGQSNAVLSSKPKDAVSFRGLEISQKSKSFIEYFIRSQKIPEAGAKIIHDSIGRMEQIAKKLPGKYKAVLATVVHETEVSPRLELGVQVCPKSKKDPEVLGKATLYNFGNKIFNKSDSLTKEFTQRLSVLEEALQKQVERAVRTNKYHENLRDMKIVLMESQKGRFAPSVIVAKGKRLISSIF